MKIYITRHSKTMWNEEKRLQGWQDSALTQEGIKDAQALHEYIKNIKIDAVFSSPLKRAYQTAKIAFPTQTVHQDHRLKEMNFGDYEGLKITDLKEDKDYYQLWHHPQSQFRLKNGESYQEVVNRLTDFFQEIYFDHGDETIFVVIHGMLFTILHGLALNLSIEHFYEVNQEIVRGCSLSLLEFNGQNFQIHYIGDDSFLNQSYEKITYQ